MDVYDLPEYMLQARPEGKAVLYIVRHGNTVLNDAEDEKLRGWSDIPLNEAGRQSAHEAAQYLTSTGITDVYSSDLRRAAETAEIIGRATNIRPKLDFELRPWDVGVLAEFPIKDILDQLTFYTVTEPNEPVKGGERYNDFYRRAKQAIYKYMIKALRYDKPIVLVTHSRILYMLEHVLTHGKKPIKYQGGPPPGSVLQLAFGDKISVQQVHPHVEN